MHGQRDLACGTINESYAEIIFERLDLQRYSRLGQEKAFGSLAKIESLGHGTKHLQAKVLQLRLAMIIR